MGVYDAREIFVPNNIEISNVRVRVFNFEWFTCTCLSNLTVFLRGISDTKWTLNQIHTCAEFHNWK